jgi:iron complex outermembrane receptor protein
VIRGFNNFENIFKNRFRSGFFTGDMRTAAELQHIERIEILKGPASLLYGNLDPGGTVHLFTKQPLDRFYLAPDLTIGSYDFYRGSVDVTGPVDAGKRLRYRFNVAYENAESFRDFVETERVFAAPVLSLTLVPGTTLTLEGEYLNDVRPIDRGLVAAQRGVVDVPISRFLGDPDRRNQFVQGLVSLVLDHRFTEAWSLRTGYRYGVADEDYDSIEAGGLRADGRTVGLSAFEIPQTIQSHQIQADLVGKVATGPIGHTLLFGVELARLRHDTKVRFAGAGTMDVFNPVYLFPALTFEKTFEGQRETDLLGLYVQNQIRLLDPLILVVGVRGDFVEQRARDRLTGATTDLDDSDVTPRVGLVYRPVPPVALYASWSRSFQPQAGSLILPGDEPFEPERGEAYEVGVKTDALNGRLVTTLALFHIVKENVLTADPNDPLRSIAVGEQRSQGIEVDVAARLLPGWSVIASYAYTDAEVTKDNTFRRSNELANVPEHGGSLWTTYEIQAGLLRGLGFGAGIFVAGERAGDIANTFDLAEYVRTDASIFYRKGIVHAALNVKNVFDVEYFEGAQSRSSVVPGTPFAVVGTVGLRY